MLQNDRRVALGGWLIAGLPILATFFQSVIALLGVDADNIPVLGGLKQLIDTIEVFDVAGVIFRSNDTVVFALFILISLSWLGVGAGMFFFRERKITHAAAGFVTLFLALFFLVYLPIFSEDVPVVQLVGFVTIPLATVSALWVGVIAFEWDTTLEDETRILFTQIRERVETANREFEQQIRQEIDTQTIERIEPVAPRAVAEFEEGVGDFNTQCEQILKEIERCESQIDGSAPRTSLQRAKQLDTQSQSIDPKKRANVLTGGFRTKLEKETRDKFEELNIVSPYDEMYAVRNMTQYNELHLPELPGPPVQVGGEAHELADRLVDVINSDTPLTDVARMVDQSKSHIDEMVETVRQNEEGFQERHDEIDKRLSETRKILTRIDSAIEQRLTEILFEKRFGDDDPPFPTVIDVHGQIETAKDNLHECRFDLAHRKIEQAVEDVNQIKQVATFFTDSVVPTVKYGSGTIPVPDEVGTDVVEMMSTEIRRVYDVDYQLEHNTLRIQTTGESVQKERTNKKSETQNREKTRSDPPVEDILYILGELRQAASEDASYDSATIQFGEYPERFSNKEIITEIETFCERESRIDHVETPDVEQGPGYLKITVIDSQNPHQVLSDLCEKYRKNNT